MEVVSSLSRWLCSFYADKVRTCNRINNTITCGDNVLLCIIELTNPKSEFTDCHEDDKTVVLYNGRVAASQDFKVRIVKEHSRRLKVFFMTQRAGRATVRLDLGKWYQFEDQNIEVHVLPSSPKYLANVKVTCCERPIDEKFEAENGTLYYGSNSMLEFQVVDKYRNLIKQIKDEQHYDVIIQWHDKRVSHLKWEIRGGQIFAIFLPPNLIGKIDTVVRLVDKKLNSMDEGPTPHKITITVLDPPCSPSLTLTYLHDTIEKRCVAGNDFTFDLQLYDVFGSPIRQDSKAICNVAVKATPPSTAMKQQRKEQDEDTTIEKITTSRNLSFAVKVNLKMAGHRRVKVIVNYFSKEINVEVLPSSPHYLANVRFQTQGDLDESFSANPEVMYSKQWSILEANIADKYKNIVHNLDYEICLKLSSEEGNEMEMECNEVEVRKEVLRAQVKINKTGSHNLSITLTSISHPEEEFRLNEIQIPVTDAPFCLARSEFRYPDTCVAGQEMKLEILPYDVFGCPLLPRSIDDYNLTGDILNSPSKHEENIKLEIKKNELNMQSHFSVVFTKAGSKLIKISEKANKSRELVIHVIPDLSKVHWRLTSTLKETAYRRERLALTARLVDRFHNEVSSVLSQHIPRIVQQAGPDGLECEETSLQNNTVSVHYSFNKTGKYTLCLAYRDSNHSLGTVLVENAPLDPRRSSVFWSPKYEHILQQPVFLDDKSFTCCLELKDVVGYDYEPTIAHDCVKVHYDEAEVSGIDVSSDENKIGRYNIVVPMKNLVNDDDRSPRFWFFVNGMKITKSLVFPLFEVFQEYDDEDCVIRGRQPDGNVRIDCYSVERKEIYGSDYCHLNNIKRVCKLEKDPRVYEQIAGKSSDDGDDYRDEDNMESEEPERGVVAIFELEIMTIIELEIMSKTETQRCRQILLHLLKALYYRKQAFVVDEKREMWKNMASENYDKFNFEEANFCRQIKEKYARLMERYHNAACDEFFHFFNDERGQSEIDLHGLLVVDEKKLHDYKRQLQKKGRLNPFEIDKTINEKREHGNEAVRKLKERLANYDMTKAREDQEPWLEIIVGSGHHSKIKERQQIRPKIEDYLKKRKLEFRPVNKGALVVTFEEYRGREPCFGEYYCTKCNNRWRNGRSWIGKWQACFKCHKRMKILQKCYPLKQRPRKKWLKYKPVVSRGQDPIPHLIELCQKCIELGKLCPQVC